MRSDPKDRIPKYLVRRGPDECWEWSGGMRTLDGYPQLCDFRSGKAKSVYVHRLVYELTVGEIPEGYEVDHTCYNPGCLNPAHLEAVPMVVNRRRQRVVHDPVTGCFMRAPA